jgi:hypothetical protein
MEERATTKGTIRAPRFVLVNLIVRLKDLPWFLLVPDI